MHLISHKYKYILQIFRKSGCSTLKNLFLNLHWEELGHKHPPAEEAFHTGLSNRSHHYRCWTTDDIYEKYKDYHKIYVVRNSYERAVSMYFNIYLDIPDFNSLPPDWYIKHKVANLTTNPTIFDGLTTSNNVNFGYRIILRFASGTTVPTDEVLAIRNCCVTSHSKSMTPDGATEETVELYSYVQPVMGVSDSTALTDATTGTEI